MSNNEVNAVKFLKCSVPDYPTTEKYAKYDQGKDCYSWQEYFYDVYDIDVQVKDDFVAIKNYITNDYDGLAGIWFFKKYFKSGYDDYRKTLETEGFVFTGEEKDAMMLHYNGADDYITDFDQWEDLKDNNG